MFDFLNIFFIDFYIYLFVAENLQNHVPAKMAKLIWEDQLDIIGHFHSRKFVPLGRWHGKWNTIRVYYHLSCPGADLGDAKEAYPLLGQHFFIFMQLSGKTGHTVGWCPIKA